MTFSEKILGLIKKLFQKIWKWILGFGVLAVLCVLGVIFFDTSSPLMPLFSATDEGKNAFDTKMAQENAERDKQNGRKILNYSITADPSPITFWDGMSAKKKFTVQNDSDIVFSSAKVEGTSYNINIYLKLRYQNNEGQEVKRIELPIRSEIQPKDNIFQDIEMPFFEGSGTIEVSLMCKDDGELCDTSTGKKWSSNFTQGSVRNEKIIIVDATRIDDTIEISNFRNNFYDQFGLSIELGDKILKATYSDKFVRENQLGGAIILANPKKYPGDGDVFIQKIKKMILSSYTHLQNVIFLSYSSENFYPKTYLLSDCVDTNTCVNLSFPKLDSYKNAFSKGIFDANPDLDILIIIPAASDQKKVN